MSNVLARPFSRKSTRSRKLGKRWDWPAEPRPDLDEDRYEPAPKPVGNSSAPADRPFEVYSASGRVLDRFADCRDAVAAMNRWPAAQLVAQSGRVVVRKAAGECGAAKNGNPPPLCIGIYDRAGELVLISELPDPRNAFCAGWKEGAKQGHTARPLDSDELIEARKLLAKS